MRIDNWSLVVDPDPYKAPEQLIPRIQGIVFGNPKFSEGLAVTTSAVVGRRGDNVCTRSGSEYQLGYVDPLYEAAFPDALNRLFKTLKETNTNE